MKRRADAKGLSLSIRASAYVEEQCFLGLKSHSAARQGVKMHVALPANRRERSLCSYNRSSRFAHASAKLLDIVVIGMDAKGLNIQKEPRPSSSMRPQASHAERVAFSMGALRATTAWMEGMRAATRISDQATLMFGFPGV